MSLYIFFLDKYISYNSSSCESTSWWIGYHKYDKHIHSSNKISRPYYQVLDCCYFTYKIHANPLFNTPESHTAYVCIVSSIHRRHRVPNSTLVALPELSTTQKLMCYESQGRAKHERHPGTVVWVRNCTVASAASRAGTSPFPQRHQDWNRGEVLPTSTSGQQKSRAS